MSKSGAKFILIDGHGGSGKSTLANRLAGYLDAEVIHIDDFTGEGATTDWYRRLIDEVIAPSSNGSKYISYARAKWWPRHNPEPVINQRVARTMIIEGVCSCRSELRDFGTYKIFVDTPRDICIERGLARDKSASGKSEKEIIALWNQWMKWDDEYFAKEDPRETADIVVNGTDPYDVSIKSILPKLNFDK